MSLLENSGWSQLLLLYSGSSLFDGHWHFTFSTMGGWENWVSNFVVSNRTSKTWSNYPFLRSKFMWLSEALLERTATKVFQFTFTFMLYVLLRSPGSWVCWWWWHSITPHHIGNPKHGTVTNGPLLTKAENIHLSVFYCVFSKIKMLVIFWLVKLILFCFSSKTFMSIYPLINEIPILTLIHSLNLSSLSLMRKGNKMYKK